MNCPRCHTTIPADGPAGMCPKCLLSVGLGEPEIVLTASGEPAPPPPTPEELQPHFPQFEILRLVGRGGMGAVYEARQKGLARSVAVKILSAPTRADSSFEERFVREAQALARLSHENIVAVYDAGRAGPHFFLAMEYVDGPNLRQAERAGHIEPAQAIAIVMQICAALDYAHKNGVVHRDIKPENVLLTRDGRVKIVDFGLAKVLDRAARGLSLTRMSQTMGTPHYMAPEQIEHPKEVDHRADIYSLGVVFYELLTGELPLGRFPLPSQRVQIDVRLDDIVIRTLEKEPGRRYQAASEVRTAVQDVSDSPPPRVAADVAKSRRLRDRIAAASPWAILVGILLLIGLGLVGAGLLFLLLTFAPVSVALAPPSKSSDSRELAVLDLTPGSGTPGLVVDAGQAREDRALLRSLRDASMNEFEEALARAADPVDRVEALDALLTVLSGEDREQQTYLEHEAEHTTLLPLTSEREVAAARIAPDPAVVHGLRAALRRSIALVSGSSHPEPEKVEWLVREHMPFDDGPVDVRIERGASQWIVTRKMTGLAPVVDEFDEDLPIAYRRLIERYRDRSASSVTPWPDGVDPLTVGVTPIPNPIEVRSDLSRTDALRVWGRARNELATGGRAILEQYQRVQANNTTNAKLTRESEVARLHIAAFPATRAALVLALRMHLSKIFTVPDVQLLDKLDFERAVFPFGEADVDVSIAEEDGLWTATVTGDGGNQSSVGLPELPDPYARLLALYRARR